MERIGLVSKDRRLQSDLGKWIQDLPVEVEFVDLGPPATGDPPTVLPADTPGEAAPAPDKKPILVIFDSTYGIPLAKIRETLGLGDVPWLAIGTEDHARNPHAPIINGATDLILLPLDRSVFLQKIEYLLAGDANITPSFLYLAKADLPIELAKAVNITHISETGCKIRSPRHVANGVEGTLISKIFGSGSDERIEVRAIESVPCFDHAIAGNTSSEPYFEVQLRFFGLRQKQLSGLRKWITSHLPHGLPEITRSEDEPASKVTIALISPQKGFAADVRSALENLAHAEIFEFQGFKRFLSAIEPTDAEKSQRIADGPLSALPWSKEFVGPRTRDEMIPIFPHPKTTLEIRLQTDAMPMHVEKIRPPLARHEPLIGAESEAWSRDLAPLTNALDETDRDAFLEAVDWVVANSTPTNKPDVQIVATLRPSPSSQVTAILKISVLEFATPARSALVEVQIEEELDEKPKTNSPPSTDQLTYEAVLLDASLLNVDLKARAQSVCDWLEKFDIKNNFGNRPPVIVYNANEDRVSSKDFRGTRIRQLVYDFVDRRYQAEIFISMSRPELWTSPGLAVAGLDTELLAYLGRPAQAAAVSEVSLILTDRVPMKKGTELLVMSPNWSAAPDGIWARLRSASAKGEGQFANEFIFFGASDVVQKEIRKFAREDYIKKKAQGQS